MTQLTKTQTRATWQWRPPYAYVRESARAAPPRANGCVRWASFELRKGAPRARQVKQVKQVKAEERRGGAGGEGRGGRNNPTSRSRGLGLEKTAGVGNYEMSDVTSMLVRLDYA